MTDDERDERDAANQKEITASFALLLRFGETPRRRRPWRRAAHVALPSKAFGRKA